MSYSKGIRTNKGWWVRCDAEGQELKPECSTQIDFEDNQVTTLWDVVVYGARHYSCEPCLTTREILERTVSTKGGKSFEKLKLGQYNAKTYQEVHDLAKNISESIKTAVGGTRTRVAVFSETREEWFIAALACLRQGLTMCTLYSTLSDAGLIHALNETEVSLLIASYDLMKRVAILLPNCPNILTIIVIEDPIDGSGPNVTLPKNVTMIPYKDLIRVQSTSQPDPVIKKDQVAILMYTSGSSGVPKGVELSHENILTAVIAYSVTMNIGPGDRYLAFLPLAHIMELVAELGCISLGVQILYSSPHTLTSNSTKIIRGEVGDAKLGKPTFTMAVPLVLDRIIKGMMSSVAKQGWIKSMIFNGALKSKMWFENVPLLGSALDYFIFWKAQEELGGQLRVMGVGGAPCTEQTHSTFRAIFGCSIQQGYGATETAACVTGMDEDDISTGHVGAPNFGVSLKLIAWEEGGYFLSDKPNPRGEIVVGGGMIANGYFKRPEETKQAFCEEDGIRWFKTGDIGEIDKDGCLKIIDRKKDLVKLEHGEYIALATIECTLGTHPLVDNICMVARSTRDKAVAIIVPVEDELKKYGHVETEVIGLEALCNNENIKNRILSEIQSHGLKNGLNKWEVPAAIHLSLEVWTTESGLITPSLKNRRKPLEDHYKEVINDMYKKI